MMVHQPSANALGARQDIACGNLGSARSLRTSSDHVFYDIMFFRQDQPQSEGRRHTHLRINTVRVSCSLRRHLSESRPESETRDDRETADGRDRDEPER